jgi:shikimate dehydrogenase
MISEEEERGGQCVGLVGWPVEHSVSPAMHNAAFAALGLGWRYDLLPTPPGQLENTVSNLKARYRGANVTIPYKQALLPHLDGVGDAVQAIGAVNTVVRREGRLHGHNTDTGGALAALREAGVELTGRRALVLGAGGAARALVYALSRTGCAVTIYNRTPDRAADLASYIQRTGIRVPVAPVLWGTALAGLELDAFDLLVNTTPVGMWPHDDASPWPESLPLPPRWTVFDLVYNPEETRLLAQARAAGARVLGGLDMLVHQGALAFALWTGRSAPIDVMYAAAREALRTGN